MLYIIYGQIEDYNERYGTNFNVIYDVDSLFNNRYTVEWLNNKFAKDMIEKVDKSKHEIDHIINSPYLGMIPPRMLSRGVKGLLIYNSFNELYEYIDTINNTVKKKKLVLTGEAFGDNCTDGLAFLSREKDIWMNLKHFLQFDRQVKLDAKVLNSGVYAKNGDKLNIEIIKAKIEWQQYIMNKHN